MGLKFSFIFANELVETKAENMSLKSRYFYFTGTFPGNIRHSKEVGNQLYLKYEYIKVRYQLPFQIA